MAVLRLDSAHDRRDPFTGDTFSRRTRATDSSPTLMALRRIAYAELPEDVRACEVTFVTCFRASQMLNFLTGGKPEMTFSARIWREKCTARGPISRASWAITQAFVDVACVLLRHERNHCETAWLNYVRRLDRIHLP